MAIYLVTVGCVDIFMPSKALTERGIRVASGSVPRKHGVWLLVAWDIHTTKICEEENWFCVCVCF